MQEHQLTPAEALTYVHAGHGKATLVGHSARYTYSFATPAGAEGFPPIFVRLLVAPDEYQYIGFIKGGELHAGRKGNAQHPAFFALGWYLHNARVNPERASAAEFWHSGVCGRCGRELTVPESIASGLGPICAGRVAAAESEFGLRAA